MFDEFQEKQADTQPKQSLGKTTPRPEFPELKCSVHKSPVILVCTKPDCEKRIFLCSRCVTTELDHINSCNPLAVYDDFVRYIHEPTGLKMNPTEEAQKIVKAQKSNIQQFNNHIKQEQYQIQQVVKQLNDSYKNKCAELTTSLQDQLEEEKNIYANNYEKFEQEVSADKEKDADMPKFHEIKEEIKKIGDLEQIEEYMKTILRKKQQWKEASIELRTLGKRSEDFYRQLIEEHQNNKPNFAQGEHIQEFWNTGLEKLIQEVKQKANCFQNLFNSPNGISINISQINELGLLTDKMIKADTELTIHFTGVKFTTEIAAKAGKNLSRFASLKNLTLDFSQSSISEESLNAFLENVKNLTQLTYFSFSLEGTRTKNDFAAISLAKILGSFTVLEELRLNFQFSDLHDAGTSALAEATAQLTTLKVLKANFACNHIKEEGAKNWAHTLENLKNVTDLQLSFGGYSSQRNRIKDEGATPIVKALIFQKKLNNLHLDFGFTGLHNSFTNELNLSLKELTELTSINIQLNNNYLTEKGGKKISKSLAKLPNLRDVRLNLNSNELKKDGVREVVYAFRANSNSISNLEIYLRNAGLQKDEGKTYKEDLVHGKNFNSVELYL